MTVKPMIRKRLLRPFEQFTESLSDSIGHAEIPPSFALALRHSILFGEWSSKVKTLALFLLFGGESV